jgi:transcriptional regulator with XRE-family HTH domain
MKEASLVDVPKLAALLRAKRANRGLREVATDIGGVSASTLSRLEQGNLPDLETFIRLCTWLGVSADDFMTEPGPTSQRNATPSMSDVVEAHLRADRTLPPKTINALGEMIRLAYEAAKQGKLGRHKKDD